MVSTEVSFSALKILWFLAGREQLGMNYSCKCVVLNNNGTGRILCKRKHANKPTEGLTYSQWVIRMRFDMPHKIVRAFVYVCNPVIYSYEQKDLHETSNNYHELKRQIRCQGATTTFENRTLLVWNVVGWQWFMQNTYF